MLNENNIKRYLKYEGDTLDEVTQKNFDKAKEIVFENSVINFNLVPISIKELNPSTILIDGKVTIQSANLTNFFKDSTHGYLMSATIGMDIDRLIKKYQIMDVGLAFIINAVAAEYVEYIIEERLNKAIGYANPRFSLGYGDSPLIKQVEVMKLISNSGISVLDNGLMVPSKSVSAFLRNDHMAYNKCSVCCINGECNLECLEEQ